MRRRIVVTEQHLIGGQEGAFCPIELAARDQGIHITVGSFTYRTPDSMTLPLSKRMIDFVHAYDNYTSIPNLSCPKPTSLERAKPDKYNYVAQHVSSTPS